MDRCISFPDDSESTYDIWAIIAGGTARGTVGELNSFLIHIVLWDSSRLCSFAAG
ncbi:hypothetical protein Gogos_022106, partial [Gossypium gossypioides]|nr:hypothetical protein [Gossypium gossypioides]